MKELAQAWNQVYSKAGEAIAWIQTVRQSSEVIEKNANQYIAELRRSRNIAKALAEVSTRPLTTGVFGISQAGKSYLLSSLIRGKDDPTLRGNFNGTIIDFKEAINPAGGGNEATGLVTRFSYARTTGTEDYPIELRLFNEADVIKILMNTFFSDFDLEKISTQPFASRNIHETETKIRSLIERLKGAGRSPQPYSGLDADDVVSIQAYAENWANSTAFLNKCFWPEVTELVPLLNIDERAELFSLLWGYDPSFTEMYKAFAKTLGKLGFPDTVYAPSGSMFVENPDASARENTPFIRAPHNIMDVKELRRWGTAHTIDITVLPVSRDKTVASSPVTVSSADLSALTSEFIFPLANEPRNETFKHIDVLDFPGYRARLKVMAAREATEQDDKTAVNDKFNPAALCFLRGKVAYLFERYLQRQEMNILVMCTPTTKATEVNTLPDVITKWIHTTQGESHKTRSNHPGLIWALSIFDHAINHAITNIDQLTEDIWNGIFSTTNLNAGFDLEWRKEWSTNKAFKNVFPVRTPGIPVATKAFIEFDANDSKLETGLLQPENLAKIKNSFVNDPYVKEYIENPNEAWDAVLELNDGGATYLSKHFEYVTDPSIKNNRLKDQLIQISHKLVELLPTPAKDGAAAIEKKTNLAHHIIDCLGTRIDDFGELLYRLQLPEERIRRLYRNQSSRGASATTGNRRSNGFGLVRKNKVAEEPQEEIVRSSFAQDVYNAWITHMRGLSQDKSFIKYFDIVEVSNEQQDSVSQGDFPLLTNKIIDAFVEELCIGADRCKVIQRMSEVAIANQGRGYTYAELVDIQTFSMSMIISDFLAWLGVIELPMNKRPDSPNEQVSRKVFEIYEVEMLNDFLPKLDEFTQQFNQNYKGDWATAFIDLAEKNAGHLGGLDWTPEQNAKLLDIVTPLEEYSSINQ